VRGALLLVSLGGCASLLGIGDPVAESNLQ